MKKSISLYVHIPFCVQKCLYCDFLSTDKESYAAKLQYVDALTTEIGLYKNLADRYLVRTIFFGGGTPTSLDGAFIECILEAIRSVFEVAEDAEITIEANPGTIKYSDLQTFIANGINRLSIGLQTTNDSLLGRIGRIHNYDQFLAGYNLARRAGFENINIDIMSGLPTQNLHDLAETLEVVTDLKPEHISVYSLQVEDGTPLSKDDELLERIPSEEEDRAMYAMTKKVLFAKGYQRYEFSNYSLPGKECKHNLVYWTGGEYLGFGLGAASYFKGERFSNIRDLHLYIDQMEEAKLKEAEIRDKNTYYEIFTEKLRTERTTMYIDRRMEEFMFLGLRMTNGVSKEDFQRKFEKDMFDVYGEVIYKYIREGYMLDTGDRVQFTDRGIDVSNYILSEFLLDS